MDGSFSLNVPLASTPQANTYVNVRTEDLVRAVEWSRKARILQSPTVVQLLTRVRDG